MLSSAARILLGVGWNSLLGKTSLELGSVISIAMKRSSQVSKILP